MRFDHAFVIPAYQRSPYLRQCLQSLADQSRKSAIVVATSTPNLFITRAASDFGLEVVVNPRRAGIAEDWNFALRAAEARYVTLAHQDDIYHPHFAEVSLGVLQRLQAAVCFTSYEEIDAYRRPVSGSKISQVKHLIEAIALGATERPSALRMRAFLALGNPLACSSVTFDMQTLGDFAFSDEFSSNLDWEAWLRLVTAGVRFARVSYPMVGRRHDEHTATSRLIADGTRSIEDAAIFSRIWPAPLAKAIALVYRAGY